MISPYKVAVNSQEIAVYDLGGAGPIVVATHGASLCGMMMEPMLSHLTQSFRVFTIDLRAHGQSTYLAPPEMNWPNIAADLPSVFEKIRELAGVSSMQPIFGVGHSLGGVTLLLAELIAPGSLQAAWLYEPVFFSSHPTAHLERIAPLVEGANRRHRDFDSVDAARERLGTKPPMASFDAKSLQAFLDYGLRPAGDGVELTCDPVLEAQVYQNANSGIAEQLGLLKLPIRLAVGQDDGDRVPAIKQSVSQTQVEVVELSGLDHFGPFTNPAAVGAELLQWLDLQVSSASS